KKFEDCKKPALSINAADGQENLRGKGDPERRDGPAGESAGDRPIQADGDENDQHDPEIGEAVDVQGINEMIDVEDTFAQVKNLEHEGEERDAAKHHVGKVAEQGCDKEGHLAAMFPHLFLGSLLQPPFESGGRLFVELHHWSE